VRYIIEDYKMVRAVLATLHDAFFD
jgi:hypothetical protein